MTTSARKKLIRGIKKGLLSLSSDQIFEVAKIVSASRHEDECFDCVCSHMASTSLLELED